VECNSDKQNQSMSYGQILYYSDVRCKVLFKSMSGQLSVTRRSDGPS
jgi:hypothetical protein